MAGRVGFLARLAGASDATAVEAEKLARRRLAQALAKVHRGMLVYAEAHGGVLPESLDQLSSKELGDEPLVLIHPSTGEPIGLEFTAGLKNTDSPATVVLATPALPNGKRLCCLLDGSVPSMSQEEYQAAVQHLPPLEKAR